MEHFFFEDIYGGTAKEFFDMLLPDFSKNRLEM